MQLEFPQWVGWIVGAFVLIGAAGGVVFVIRAVAILTKSYVLLVKMSSTLETFETLAPVLFDLARQFRNDSGSSALDKIEKLQADGKLSAEQVALVREALRDIRAEQTLLALNEHRQPATSQSISIGADLVGGSKSVQ